MNSAAPLRQEAILRVIREWIVDHGHTPTLEEIGAQVGLARSTVFYHLGQFEAKGVIHRGRSWRSVRLN